MAGEVAAPANELVDISKIIASLAPALFGSKVNETSTTAGAVDPAALAQSNALLQTLISRGTTSAASDALVEDILHRAQLAFAPQLAGEKVAGLYNSTTKQLLGTEAIARATGAAANAVLDAQTAALGQATQLAGNTVNATKSSTSSGTRTTPPTVNPLMSGGLLAGLAGNTIFNKIKEQFKTTPLTSAIPKATANASLDAEDADLGQIFRDAQAQSISGADAGSTFSSGGSAIGGAQPQELSGTFSALDASSAYNLTSLDAFTGVTDAVDGSIVAPDTLTADSGNGGNGGSVDLAGTGGLSAGQAAYEELIAGTEDFGSVLAGDAGINAALSGADLGVDAGISAAELGAESAALSGIPVVGAINYISGGAITEGIGEFAQDFGDLISGSVICTQLRKQQLLAKATKCERDHFSNISTTTKVGYWFWAKPYVKLMQHPRFGSVFTSLVKSIAQHRTAHVNGNPNLLGAATIYLGEPACWLLGKLILTARSMQWLKPQIQ